MWSEYRIIWVDRMMRVARKGRVVCSAHQPTTNGNGDLVGLLMRDHGRNGYRGSD